MTDKPKAWPHKQIGERIADRRNALGRARGEKFPQHELAKIVGVAETTVTAWEIGKQKPEGENLLRLARALDVPPDYILKGGPVPYGGPTVLGAMAAEALRMRRIESELHELPKADNPTATLDVIDAYLRAVRETTAEVDRLALDCLWLVGKLRRALASAEEVSPPDEAAHVQEVIRQQPVTAEIAERDQAGKRKEA